LSRKRRDSVREQKAHVTGKHDDHGPYRKGKSKILGMRCGEVSSNLIEGTEVREEVWGNAKAEDSNKGEGSRRTVPWKSSIPRGHKERPGWQRKKGPKMPEDYPEDA